MKKTRSRKSRDTVPLKVPKCEILMSWILMIFFIMKSIQVGDLRAKIKFVNFLQMGEILVILFQLPHAPSTLANCYRMRRLRQQSATACTAYACNLLPYAPSTLAKHTFLHGFATACAVYASKLLPYAPSTLAICYRMRRIRYQIATVCAVYASICNRIRQQSATACAVYTNTRSPSIPYCFSYRMRHLRQQSATVCGAYASNLLAYAPSTLASCYLEKFFHSAQS